MPIGRRHNCSAETNLVSVRTPPSEQLKRIGSNRHFKRMVLGSPYDIEATLIGHLHHF